MWLSAWLVPVLPRVHSPSTRPAGPVLWAEEGWHLHFLEAEEEMHPFSPGLGLGQRSDSPKAATKEGISP